MSDNTINCKVRPTRLFYPKEREKANNTWISGLVKVLEVRSPIDQQNRLVGTTIRVSGIVPDFDYNVSYWLTALRKVDENYGISYEIITLQPPISLVDPIEQRLFLEMVLTEKQINALYENLDSPFETINNEDIAQLSTVKGIGEKTAKKIIDNYRGNLNHAPVYSLVAEFGGTKAQADRLIAAYQSKGGDSVLISKINTNPYVLIKEVNGIGWKRADEIAIKKGMPKDSCERVQAYIEYRLDTLAQQKNSWVVLKDLFADALYTLELTTDKTFKRSLFQLQKEGVVDWNEDKTRIWLTKLYNLEKNIAQELMRIKQGRSISCSDDISDRLKPLEEQQGWEYTEEQKIAIKQILDNQVIIVTGYGGTGKSSIVRGALKLTEGLTFTQCALAGKAAARLSELTNQEGWTIHRLLGWNPSLGGFTYNANCQLDYDIIIVDEVSMVGGHLFLKLLQAIRQGTKLIMLGDDGQLESIGLCNIFKDMIDSGVITVARLTKIHRQAAKSAIITESIAIRNHIQITEPDWAGTEVRGEKQDLILKVFDKQTNTRDVAFEQYKEFHDKCKNAQSIQIVVPQKVRGNISTYELNTLIQQYVNPKEDSSAIKISVPTVKNKYYTLKTNDKVIVNKNSYHTKTLSGQPCPVYNGNQGIIESICKEYMVINFDQWGEVIIPKKSFSNVELAYALTGHKMQGSETDYIIVALDFSAYSLLTKEWLYTAITRAKKECCLCAEKEALRYCITQSNISKKKTFLQEFLKELQEQEDKNY